MKRFLLGFVFVAGLCLNVDAANPSFSSFATNHFITNNFLIRSRLNPLQFDTNASTVTITNAGGGGTTNYFNTIYVTNLYATNFYFSTNVFATNTYFTNIYVDNIFVTTNVVIGGTNAATLGDLLWTNIGGVLQPVTHSSGTNQFTIAEASGWTGAGTNAFFDDGTFNGVATINATDGAIAKRKNAYELEDLAAGTGALINDGANNFSWGSSGEWTNNAGTLQPVNLTLQPMIKNGLAVGTNTIAYYGVLNNGATLETFHDVSAGDPDFATINSIVSDSSGSGGQFTQTTINQDKTYTSLRIESFNSVPNLARIGLGTSMLDTNLPDAFFEIYAPVNGIGSVIRTRLAPTSADTNAPYLFDTDKTHTVSNLVDVANNGTNLMSVNATGGLVFGPGTTNVLYRSGNNLVYTNGNTKTGFIVDNPSSALGFFGVFGNTTRIESANSIDLAVGVNLLRWWSNTLTPMQASTELGHNGGGQYPWGNFKQQGTYYNYGFNPDVSDATNYSRLAISHTGTNGVVVLDSQASGTAGNPRPYNIRFNGTNSFEFSATSINQPQFKIVRDDGSYASLEINGGGGAVLDSSGFIYTAKPIVAYGSFLPTGGIVDVGSVDASNTQVSTVASTNLYAFGYLSGTNYSRALWTHRGTNGTVLFDSQAFGTVGNPRPFQFSGADIIIAGRTPASSSETNYVGAMTWDSNYIYVWTATNVNKRATLNAW